MKVICINDKQILGYTDNKQNVLTIGRIYEGTENQHVNLGRYYYDLLSHDGDDQGAS
jgi:hypothetical protein